jgi:adenine deaminase
MIFWFLNCENNFLKKLKWKLYSASSCIPSEHKFESKHVKSASQVHNILEGTNVIGCVETFKFVIQTSEKVKVEENIWLFKHTLYK